MVALGRESLSNFRENESHLVHCSLPSVRRRVNLQWRSVELTTLNQKIMAPRPKTNLLSFWVEKAALRQTASSSLHLYCSAPVPGVQLKEYTSPPHPFRLPFPWAGSCLIDMQPTQLQGSLLDHWEMGPIWKCQDLVSNSNGHRGNYALSCSSVFHRIRTDTNTWFYNITAWK